jgi:iron complex transport system substrate-binding protein
VNARIDRRTVQRTLATSGALREAFARALGSARLVFLTLLACATASSAHAVVGVTDDRGSSVQLPRPAKRIVSLAPHVTELLFSAGAGERVVGTTEFSDYPAAAKAIPRVGSSTLLDLERIVQLEPDLIVVWGHGTPESQLDRLRSLGIPLFYNEPRVLDDIPRGILRLGVLAGTEPQARQAADLFSTRLASLRSRYADHRPVRLFWQVWEHPLLTISGRHFISDVIRLCGGVNVFEALPALVPAVAIESVVAANPEAIITTTTDAADGSDGLDTWRKLPSLAATTRGHLIALDADTIHRASPRILDGAAVLCEQLEAVRAGR